MIHKFKIDNDYLSQTEHFDGVSGNKNVYICEFEISCDENGSVWFAVFKKGDENYVTPITDGKCDFPYECLTEPCTVYLGCYAECEGNKRISTNWLPLNIEKGAYSQGTAPDVPSRDLWETLLSNSVPVIGENGHWYTYDMQDKEYADTGFAARGEQGSKGDKGDTGEAGYTPQKGIDYFTQADIAENKEEALAILCPKTKTASLVITDAIQHNVIDYTIYVASGGVGDLVVDGDDDYAEYGGKYRIPIKVSGVNLIDTTEFEGNYTDGSAINAGNGTFTIRGRVIYDASVSGKLHQAILDKLEVGKTYYAKWDIVSGTPENNFMYLYGGQGNNTWYNGGTHTITQAEKEHNIGIAIYGSWNGSTSVEDVVYANFIISEVNAPFEPYTESQTVNIYLDEPLGAGERVSLSDTNVPIQLSRYTNNIEFGTEVQPSRVEVKYYQDINKVIGNVENVLIALRGGNAS